jgi:hypothetical protein
MYIDDLEIFKIFEEIPCYEYFKEDNIYDTRTTVKTKFDKPDRIRVKHIFQLGMNKNFRETIQVIKNNNSKKKGGVNSIWTKKFVDFFVHKVCENIFEKFYPKLESMIIIHDEYNYLKKDHKNSILIIENYVNFSSIRILPITNIIKFYKTYSNT